MSTIYRFEAFAVKATRPIVGILYTPSSSILEEKYPNTLLSLIHCDVHHGVEADVLEDERFE